MNAKIEVSNYCCDVRDTLLLVYKASPWLSPAHDRFQYASAENHISEIRIRAGKFEGLASLTSYITYAKEH